MKIYLVAHDKQVESRENTRDAFIDELLEYGYIDSEYFTEEQQAREAYEKIDVSGMARQFSKGFPGRRIYWYQLEGKFLEEFEVDEKEFNELINDGLNLAEAVDCLFCDNFYYLEVDVSDIWEEEEEEEEEEEDIAE